MRTGLVGSCTMAGPVAVRMIAAGNDPTFLRQRPTPSNDAVVAAGGVPGGQMFKVVQGPEAIVLLLPERLQKDVSLRLDLASKDLRLAETIALPPDP